MDRDELISVLEDAGLSPYQADAFVTILKLGSSSATDIAKASSVPDPRIYDVLRDLEGKGYIETYEQDSLHARAHSPTDVLADLRTRATRFEDAAAEIDDRWSQPDIEAHKVSIVKRMDTVLDRAESIIRDSETQIQASLTPAQFDRLAGALEEAATRGVNIRLCLNPAVSENRRMPTDRDLAATCTEARYRNIPSPFVTLVDRSETCFSPHGRPADQYGVLVNDRTHAHVFNWYFQTCLWDAHETAYSGRPDEPPITYVDLRRFVRETEPLLADGARLEITVSGYEIGSKRAVEKRGVLLDVTYGGGIPDTENNHSPVDRADEVSMTFETDDGTYTAGGWGAILEDLEATQIVLESVSR